MKTEDTLTKIEHKAYLARKRADKLFRAARLSRPAGAERRWLIAQEESLLLDMRAKLAWDKLEAK